MIFLKIALRNTFRNRRRTLLSLSIVGLGVAMLSLVIGFVLNSLDSTKAELARESGALQVAARALFDNQTQGFEYLIPPEAQAQVAALLDADPRVAGHAAQLGFGGVIGNERGSTALIGRGIVPGNPLEDYAELVEAGGPLDGGGAPQIIVGRELAEGLGVAPGDWVNVATGTVSGAFKAASVQIRGTFRYNNAQYEGQFGFVPLSFAQKILRTDGVERLSVKLFDLDQAAAVAADLNVALAELGLEARTWEELTTFYESIRQFWVVFAAFTVMGVFVLAFFSVLEVLTMSFLERVREVGTVRAVGTNRLQVFATFLAEGALLGGLGGALGVALSLGAAALLNAAGVGWMPPGAIDPVPIHIELGALSTAVPFLVGVLSTLLGTLYPAAKNARLNIVRALSYT